MSTFEVPPETFEKMLDPTPDDAPHLRAMAATAWDEGYRDGQNDGAEHEQRMQMRDWWGEEPTRANPYRATP